jgi:hypothetical protein
MEEEYVTGISGLPSAKRAAHDAAVARLRDAYAAVPAGVPVRLAKPTSNLFRYSRDAAKPGQPGSERAILDVSAFSRVIHVDTAARTAVVGGMRGVGPDIDRLNRAGGGDACERCQRDCRRGKQRLGARVLGAPNGGAEACGAQRCQKSTSKAGSRRRSRHDDHRSPERIATRLCAEFAATGAPRGSSSPDPCAIRL